VVNYLLIYVVNNFVQVLGDVQHTYRSVLVATSRETIFDFTSKFVFSPGIFHARD